VRYADRAHIMRTIQPHLTQYGLSVAFDSDASDSERFTVFCIVRHIGGHSERTTFACPREQASKRMNVSQAEGSASEYAQRYALKLALNLTTGDNDDDAETAGAKPRLSDEQVASLSAIIDEIEGEREVNLEKFVKWAGVLVIEDIAAERYDECVRVAEAGRKSGK